MSGLFKAIAQFADAEPGAVAILTEQDGTRTFRELVDHSLALAVSLRSTLAVPTAGRVGIWMVNHPSWIETYLAASLGGMVPVAMDPSWTDAEIAHAVTHADIAAVICDSERARRLLALGDGVASVRHVVAVELDGTPSPEGAVAYGMLVPGANPTDQVSLPPADGPTPTTQIMFTSGTSAGRPRAVVLGLGARGGADYREMFGLDRNDRAIIVTPFFHSNGLGGTIVALTHGASVVFPRRFSAARFWPLVDRYRPTYLFTLAPIANILLSRGVHPAERRHNIRVGIIAAGGAANRATIEDRFGFPVLDIYGMTETVGSGAYNKLSDPPRPGSCGRPGPGSTMQIVRDDGTSAPAFEIGEVVYDRSSIVFTEYLGDETATSADIDGEHFRTGDLGYFDDEGYFYFVDRKKDMLRRGGENIWSVEIEEVLRSSEHIADAAVVGKPDPVLGERVAAFVIPAEAAARDAAAIRSFAQERLAAFKVPEDIMFVEELPRTATGKVIKARLREQLLRPSSQSS